MDTKSASTAPSNGSAGELQLSNQLNRSRSPYVRGHMNNPVAWQMWTPETLALAKKHDRVLFVSIGYAACHWCHVMERESFENQEIANLINKNFVPIKIDREERPDVDRIYMNYVQATTGSGGWPLNVFLTPDLEPLFGGTYWPGPGSTMARGEMIDFQGILNKIKDVWHHQRERCLTSAREVTAHLREFAQEGTVSKPDDGQGQGDGLEVELLDDALRHFTNRFDKQFPGFNKAPKFPTPVNLSFLLSLGRMGQTVKDVVGEDDCENAKSMVLKTLTAMTNGGIHDQVGNGFARYSVTRDWSLPHFEKMLYDQAQLLRVYTDAYSITRDELYLDAVRDIATYMTTPPLGLANGGICSAEDADSYYRPSDNEKREGAFYVWTKKELTAILGDRDGEICARYYNVCEHGNVSPEHDVHDELMNQNVLAVSSTPEALSKEFGLSVSGVKDVLARSRTRLREHRDKERPRPALDDKIVVSWNGLAIGSLARAYSLLTSLSPEGFNVQEAQGWLEAAKRIVSFVKKELYDENNGTLKRVYREGPGDAPGFADDYAFLISGLIDLYEATFDDSFLEWADRLQKTELDLFWDSHSHGFFSTQASQADLLLRLKDGMDNAEPSANGLSARNLFRLGALLADEQYTTQGRQTCEAFEAELMQHPFLFAGMLDSAVAARHGTRAVTVCGGDSTKVIEAIKRERVSNVGLATIAINRLGAGKFDWLRHRNHLLANMKLDKEMIQLCEGTTCREVNLDQDTAQVEKIEHL